MKPNHPKNLAVTLQKAKIKAKRAKTDNPIVRINKKEIEENINNNWLLLLQQAIASKEDVKVNHRYLFEGKKLGTWLVGISQANKEGRKLEWFAKIEAAGFHFASKSRKIEDVISRFLADLRNAENPNKTKWRNRFVKHINKKEKLDEKTVSEIERLWLNHFSEAIVWGKVHERYVDKTEEWIAYRKKKKRWYPIEIKNGEHVNLSQWVKRKHNHETALLKLKHRFSKKQIGELIEAGFIL